MGRKYSHWAATLTLRYEDHPPLLVLVLFYLLPPSSFSSSSSALSRSRATKKASFRFALPVPRQVSFGDPHSGHNTLGMDFLSPKARERGCVSQLVAVGPANANPKVLPMS
ncbi:unnamed protein product [Hydatigera taeniaeformis]|uniref:Secreted protein n=1 Tax=Hydatigena taeniaeformis TaxID=6205 RepID=A0A0R3X5W1_HYDTA|nr:unnamed protein product [Hydatigera taeniaeformis]